MKGMEGLMSRKIEDLVAIMQILAREFAVKMAEAGIPFMFTATYRSQEEQDALYAQGRTKPGKIVTWTRHSKHTTKRAFDIAILSKGKPIWDTKVDVNKDDIPDYMQAGEIGKSLRLVWGGDFVDERRRPRPDYCHFQLEEA